MDGWIKIHRKLLDWEWYSDLNVRVLFLHCLLRANFEEQKWQGKIIKVGQFVTSIEHLSSETGLTTQQTRTALKKLENTGEINKQSTSGYSIITILNWDKWQDNNKRITNEQQTNNKRITTIKEIKKERNKEIKNKEINNNNNTHIIDSCVSDEIEKIFQIYKNTCPNLCKLRFERRIKTIRDLAGDYLKVTESDFELFKKICIKANELKEIAGNKIDIKTILNNYNGILNDKYKKPAKANLSSERILELIRSDND